MLVPADTATERSAARIELPPSWTDLDVARVRAFLLLLWRNRFVFAVCLLLFGGMGILHYLEAPREYSASIDLLLGASSASPAELMPASNTIDSENSVATQVELLRSSHLAQLVADSEHLTAADVNALSPEHPWSRAFASVLDALKMGVRKHKAAAAAPSKPAWRSLQDAVRVDRVDRSYVVTVRVSAVDPDLAYRLARAYGGAFLQDQIGANIASISQTMAWLREHPELPGSPSDAASGGAPEWLSALTAIASTDQGLLIRPTARVVSDAVLPDEADRPRLVQDLFGWLVAGVILAGGLVALRELADRTYRNGVAIRNDIGLPFWGYIPPLTGGFARFSRRPPKWASGAIFGHAELIQTELGPRTSLGIVSLSNAKAASEVARAMTEHLARRGIPSVLLCRASESPGGASVEEAAFDWHEAHFLISDLGAIQDGASPTLPSGELPDAYLLLVDWGRTPRALVRRIVADYPQLLQRGVGVILTSTRLRAVRAYDPSGAALYRPR